MRSGAHSSLFLLAVACGERAPIEGSAPPVGDRTTSLGMPVDQERYEVLGAGVAIGPALAVADVLADPAAFAGRPLRVEGEVLRMVSAEECTIAVGTERGHLLVCFTPALVFPPSVAPGRVIVCEGEFLDARGTSAAPVLVATGAALRR